MQYKNDAMIKQTQVILSSNGITFKQEEEVQEKDVIRIQVVEDEIDVVP